MKFTENEYCIYIYLYEIMKGITHDHFDRSDQLKQLGLGDYLIIVTGLLLTVLHGQ